MTNSTDNGSNLGPGYVIAVVSAAILSTTAIFIRYLTQTYEMPALVLAFWRDSFVALSLLAALGLMRSDRSRVKRQHLTYLIIYGFVLAIFNSLWTLSVALNGAAVSTVLVYSSAGFTALLGRWLLRENLGWAKLVAVAVCLGGCVLVAEAFDPAVWNVNLVGILTGILSGLGYAIYSLMGRSASQRGLNAWTTVLYTFAFAAAFLLFFNLLPAAFGPLPGAATSLEELLWLGKAWVGWGILALLAVGPTVAGFGLYNISLGYLPSSVANLILTLEPAFTVVIAYLLLGEHLNGLQLGGSLMILSGVVFLRIYEGRMAKQIKLKPQTKWEGI